MEGKYRESYAAAGSSSIGVRDRSETHSQQDEQAQRLQKKLLMGILVSMPAAPETSEGQLRFEFENHVHTVIFSRKQMVRVRGTEFGVGNRVLFCLAATMPNNAAQSSDPPLRACVVASCPQDPYLKMEFLQKLSTESSKVCRLKWLDSMLEDVLGRPFDGEISVFSRVPGSDREEGEISFNIDSCGLPVCLRAFFNKSKFLHRFKERIRDNCKGKKVRAILSKGAVEKASFDSKTQRGVCNFLCVEEAEFLEE